jgi:hypothetical protein
VLALLLALMALGMLLLVLSARGLIRQMIIIPALYLLWLADLLIQSTPQWLFWAVLVLTALPILLKSLGTGERREARPRALAGGQPRRERVAFWAIQLRLAQRGAYSSARFVEALKRLTLEVLAYREQVSPLQAQQQLETGELDVPREIVTYLERGARWTPERAGWRARLAARLAALFSPARPASDLELENVVRFLEDCLEIKHVSR